MTVMNLHRYPSPSGGIALGKMGVGATMLKQGKTARDYVQDGLVAMWDGIENAGWGTHDASATTWKDLINGITFSLGSVYSFGNNYITRVPSSTYATATMPTSLQSGSPTIEVCYEYESSDFAQGYMISLNGDAFSIGYNYTASSNQPFTRTTGVHQFATTIGAHSISMVMTTEPYSSGKNRYYRYIDAVSQGYNDYTSSATFYRTMRLMKISTVGTTYNLKCHSIRLYSRALTAAEIARNYAIDKERFNLP